jgi:hypothetical protein
MDNDLQGKMSHRSCTMTGIALGLCAAFSILSSPVLGVHFWLIYKHILPFVTWRLSLLIAPLSLVLTIFLFIKSRENKQRYLWAYGAAVVALLMSGLTLLWALEMSGLSRGP